MSLITNHPQRVARMGGNMAYKKKQGVSVIFRLDAPNLKKISTCVFAIIRDIFKKKILKSDPPLGFYNKNKSTLFKN